MRLFVFAPLLLLSLVAPACDPAQELENEEIPANHLPLLQGVTAVAVEGGLAEVSFTLIDEDQEPCTVEIEWSVDGSTYHTATSSGGESLEEVAATIAGEDYLFLWDAATDLEDRQVTSAIVRLIARDDSGRGPAEHVELSFPLPGLVLSGPILTRSFADQVVKVDDLGISLAHLDLSTTDTEFFPPSGEQLDSLWTLTPKGSGVEGDYAFSLPEPPPSSHFQSYSLDFGVDTRVALYALVIFEDDDRNGIWNPDIEPLAGTSRQQFALALDYGAEIPEGAPPPGWYLWEVDPLTGATVLSDVGTTAPIYLWTNPVLAGKTPGSVDLSSSPLTGAGPWFIGALTCTNSGTAEQLSATSIDPLESDPPIEFTLAIPDVPDDHLTGPYLEGHHYAALESLGIFEDVNGNGRFDNSSDLVWAWLAPPGDPTGSESLLYLENDLSPALLYFYTLTGCGLGWNRYRQASTEGAFAFCEEVVTSTDVVATPHAVPSPISCPVGKGQ